MWINQIFGWVWIFLGFLSGTLMGLFFHDEKWLGGYGSHRRRLIRLGHISFLGLGILNILFCQTFLNYTIDSLFLVFASWLFIAGGVMMPLCCGIMAWKKNWYLVFSFPVTALTLAVFLIIVELIKK